MAKIIGDVVGVPNPKSDWSQNDSRKADYIKNKPDLNVYANVLKGNASGEVIGITDISPIEHNLGVKLSSKNLIPYPYANTTKTMNGITFTDNGDGSITLNGTAEITSSFHFTKEVYKTDNIGCLFEDGETYFASLDKNISGVNIVLVSYTYDDVVNYFYAGKSFTVDKSKYKYSFIRLQVNGGTTLENVTVKPMIEKGTKATAYTPYVDDVSTTTLNTLGKNLFNNDTDLIEQQTFHNSSGTEYKRYGYKPLLLPKGTYTFSANLINTQAEGVHLYVYKVNADDVLVGSAIYIANGTTLYTPTFTMDNGEKIIICNGDGASSISKTKKWFGWFNIQLEAGNGATPYESYCPTNYTPNADGTVEGVKSIYPNTTLTTDTSGVLIECEYNKDTNKVIENLVNAIISLGGNV